MDKNSLQTLFVFISHIANFKKRYIVGTRTYDAQKIVKWNYLFYNEEKVEHELSEIEEINHLFIYEKVLSFLQFCTLVERNLFR